MGSCVLVAALDVPGAQAARQAALQLPAPVWYKIGLELFTCAGPSLVQEFVQQQKPVFLDLKFHDIPNTVQGACRNAAALGVSLLSIHVSGGEAMAHAALQGVRTGAGTGAVPKVLGITVLTSQQVGSAQETQQQVVAYALEAKRYGLDGIVCSGLEAAAVKAACGPSFLCLCPGIRFADAGSHDDQQRVCTPSFAAAAGADFIVMGRPLLQADNPQAAAEAALLQIAK